MPASPRPASAAHPDWSAPTGPCRPGPVGVTVAVRVRGRPWLPVVSDMVEGIVAANGLVGPPADRARDVLWRAVAEDPPGQAGQAQRVA